jgi:hypothetical protein
MIVRPHGHAKSTKYMRPVTMQGITAVKVKNTNWMAECLKKKSRSGFGDRRIKTGTTKDAMWNK